MADVMRLNVIQRDDWPDVIKMQLHGEFREYVCVEVVNKDAYVTEDGDSWDVVNYELVEKVVRCRDCKHFCHDSYGDWCTLHDFEDARGMADMFCAWGERRSE